MDKKCHKNSLSFETIMQFEFIIYLEFLEPTLFYEERQKKLMIWPLLTFTVKKGNTVLFVLLF